MMIIIIIIIMHDGNIRSINILYNIAEVDRKSERKN